MTPKGFTFIEVELAEGVSIDIYNVHTDAGGKDADLKARAANLAQLGDYISDYSAGNAVIVMGDTNTRYTREHDTIREFIEAARLTDGWVQSIRNGVPPEKGAEALKCDTATMTNECEVVDKIMFRGNNYITLTLDKWNNENAVFLAKALADPTEQDFQIEKLYPLDKRDTYKTLRLGTDEYITSMEVHWGKHKRRTRIFYLNFTTSEGNYVAGGSMTDDKSTTTAPMGYQLGGFFGRDGKEIDALGVIWTKIENV
ncbi:Hypothetical protein PHPALM_9419 [Phytophthora palmivora]|uniref:Jacalin-type lectin domain-containing protein n=1 Tax=Phytophthora palmivora TaxID=4796 RepID=A0A2P4Y7C4_9STRA|nr:Hypothetical protein PHPALM_9419 [Phytophthora palmivora]